MAEDQRRRGFYDTTGHAIGEIQGEGMRVKQRGKGFFYNPRGPDNVAMTVRYRRSTLQGLQADMEINRFRRSRSYLVNRQLQQAHQMELMAFVPPEELTDEFIDAEFRNAFAGLEEVGFDEQERIVLLTPLAKLPNEAIRRIQRAILAEFPAEETRRRHWLWRNREDPTKKFDRFEAYE
jgi:hypothetical protein